MWKRAGESGQLMSQIMMMAPLEVVEVVWSNVGLLGVRVMLLIIFSPFVCECVCACICAGMYVCAVSYTHLTLPTRRTV